jgi:hypothetical protein
MSDTEDELIESVQAASAGGIAADHLPLPLPIALVAPATAGKEHNTLKLTLAPFACWRADDLRFEFESSFLLPEMVTEMGALKRIIDRHTRRAKSTSRG